MLNNCTQTLSKAEIMISCLLANTPEMIAQGQLASQDMKEKYQRLKLQIRQVEQILTLISVIYRICSIGVRKSKKLSLKKKVFKSRGLVYE